LNFHGKNSFAEVSKKFSWIWNYYNFVRLSK